MSFLPSAPGAIMSSASDPLQLPVDFNGRVRVFPLPNLVMFPNVIQPLHIFEPRYCQLLEDALQTDGLIAMSLLKPGWEQDYDGRPEMEKTVCLGRIAAHAQQADGRYNIFLQGVRRAIVKREIPSSKLYREADVALLRDVYRTEAAAERVQLQRELLDSFRRQAPASSSMQEQFEQATGRPMQLGGLTDVIAFSLGLDLRTKQELLNEVDVDQRAEFLISVLQLREQARQRSRHRRYPLKFSDN